MDYPDLRQQVIAFLDSVARPGCEIGAVSDTENLFDQGIMDSFALVQIIVFLEQQYAVQLHTLGIDPADLGTIAGIIASQCGIPLATALGL